jgi:hypothetical protein
MRDIRAGNIVGLFFVWRMESRRDAAPTVGNDEGGASRGDVLYKTYACW